MSTAEKLNSHALYGTVGHLHLDSLTHWATGEYPDSGLMLVECADGRWFVEVDFGDRFDAMEGVSRPYITPDVAPVFFKDETAARNFSMECLKLGHPDLKERNLQPWFDEYDLDE